MFSMYDMYGGAKKAKKSASKKSPAKKSPAKKSVGNKRCSQSNPAYVRWKASAPKGAKCIANSQAKNRSEANTRNKRAVLKGTAFKTASGLVKSDLKINKWGKPVSVAASAAATKRFKGSVSEEAFRANRKVLKGAYSGSPKLKKSAKKSPVKKTAAKKKTASKKK